MKRTMYSNASKYPNSLLTTTTTTTSTTTHKSSFKKKRRAKQSFVEFHERRTLFCWLRKNVAFNFLRVPISLKMIEIVTLNTV